MHNRKVGMLIGGVLAVCYTFIYILLQIESYALLVGIGGLFVVLAVAMSASRKVEWYKDK
jgi:inner membrane protein